MRTGTAATATEPATAAGVIFKVVIVAAVNDNDALVGHELKRMIFRVTDELTRKKQKAFKMVLPRSSCSYALLVVISDAL